MGTQTQIPVRYESGLSGVNCQRIDRSAGWQPFFVLGLVTHAIQRLMR